MEAIIVKIAIIDDIQSDRAMAAGYLQTFFSKYPNMNPITIYEFDSGEIFMENFIPNSFCFIFIDYYMNGISGIETARRIRQIDDNVILIFITLSRDYAIDGYKVKASGYLLKPYEYNDLEEILLLIDIKKLRDKQFIEIDTGNRIVRILLNEIIYCDISGHYVQIHTHNAGLLKFRMTFSQLTLLLHPYKRFLSCYRGCIINMKRVDRIENLNFFMDNGEQVPFCKKEQTSVMKLYYDYLFEEVRESQ